MLVVYVSGVGISGELTIAGADTVPLALIEARRSPTASRSSDLHNSADSFTSTISSGETLLTVPSIAIVCITMGSHSPEDANCIASSRIL